MRFAVFFIALSVTAGCLPGAAVSHQGADAGNTGAIAGTGKQYMRTYLLNDRETQNSGIFAYSRYRTGHDGDGGPLWADMAET